MDPSDAARSSHGARLGVGAAIVLVLAVAAVVIAIAVWRGATAPVEIVPDGPVPAGAAAPDGVSDEGAAGATEGAGGAGGVSGENAPAGNGGELFVHVFGAVEKPGLYALPAGARVVDALSAAGGATDDAAPEGVNLARGLSDGEQIGVPTAQQLESGEAAAPVPGAAGGQTGGAGSAAQPVNLNTADQAALETLPGIGPALAERMIAWREENGGFSSVDDLLAVSGIGEKVLAGLQDQVTV